MIKISAICILLILLIWVACNTAKTRIVKPSNQEDAKEYLQFQTSRSFNKKETFILRIYKNGKATYVKIKNFSNKSAYIGQLSAEETTLLWQQINQIPLTVFEKKVVNGAKDAQLKIITIQKEEELLKLTYHRTNNKDIQSLEKTCLNLKKNLKWEIATKK